MKKNQLYHPIVKALCLILCITCILTFTFCTLRAFYLDDLGIMYDDPQFSVPSDSQSLQYSDFTLYWPYDYAWDTVDLLNPWAWSASDPLRAYLCELLYTGDYYSYLGLSSEGRVPNEKPPIYPDTDYTPDTDMVTDSVTTSPTPNYSEESSDAVTNGLAEKP
ncbi:MAG: hypothetical protein J6S76_06960, partial [Clostridia bacterium]|nr:hypothetical protein [Clostridia bacterium]